MGIHHRNEFLDWLENELIPHAGRWRLFESLPCFELDRLGQPLAAREFRDKFGRSHTRLFKSFFRIHEGELLVLEGQWRRALHPAGLTREAWHVQYATDKRQRRAMCRLELPGTQTKKISPPLAASAGREVRPSDIGSTLVCQLGADDLTPIAMMEGKVLTWPQVFLLGAQAQLTAMEIFTFGCHLPLMLSVRERSQPNPDTRDAALARHAQTGWYGHGWMA